MNVKCPNCDAEILRIVIEGKDVEFALRPTDSEMLDWLQRVIFDESETYGDTFQFVLAGSDEKTIRVRGYSSKPNIREAIAAAMRESGDE